MTRLSYSKPMTLQEIIDAFVKNGYGVSQDFEEQPINISAPDYGQVIVNGFKINRSVEDIDIFNDELTIYYYLQDGTTFSSIPLNRIYSLNFTYNRSAQ